MANHSPAPWTVERAVNGELAPFDANGAHLLFGEGPLPLEEREANGLVIGAAPELVRVLSSALEAFGGAFDSDDEVNGGDLVEWFAEWRLEARTALAAAGIKA